MTCGWRHLGGFITEGSTLTDLLDPLVHLVPWAVVAGLAAAAVLTVGMRRRPWLLALSAALVVGTLLVGRSSVSDWGYSPLTQPRLGHTVCVGTSPSVCVPQEYAKNAEDLRTDSLPALRALRTAGLPSPDVLRMASRDLPLKRGTWPLQWSPDMSVEQLDAELGQSAVAGVAAASGVRDCDEPSVAGAWAMLVDGVGERDAEGGLTSDDVAQLQRVRSLPAARQAAWFDQAVRGQRWCVPVMS